MDGGGGADRPTPAMDGGRPGLSLLSGPVCAAVFVCFALSIIIFFVYSFLARRRDISDARERFFRGMRERDIEVPGWPGNLPVSRPPPAATTTTPRRVEGGNSSSNSGGPGDCPVCLEPLQLQGGSDIMAAHACGHVFHAPCIEPWLPQGGTCPVCPANPTFTSGAGTLGLIPTPASNSSPHVPPPPPPPPPPPSQPAPRRPRRPQGANSTSTSIGDCPVCMEPLQQVGGGNTMAAAPAHASVHVFHSSCIQSWLHQQGSCPICRCTMNSTFTSNNPNPTLNPNSTSNSNSNSSTVGDCPVCLQPLRVDSGAISAAHACGHVLHSRCIQRWLRERGSCPVCRCTANHDSNSVDSSSPIGDCSVCLEPLRVPGGDVTAAHACGHVFHSRCIDQWLRICNSCPECRCNVSCSRGNPRNQVLASAPAAAASARHIQDTMVVVIVEETTE